MTDKEASGQGRLWARVEESFQKQAFLSLIGAQLRSVEEGRVEISCRRRPDLGQQQGLLHGGVVATIGDVTCGYTALTMMPEGCEVLTAEFKIHLLRPVMAEEIVAVGQVVKAGRSLIITEAEIRDAESGKMIAKMLGTMVPTSQDRL